MSKQVPVRVAAWFDREVVSEVLQRSKTAAALLRPAPVKAGVGPNHPISRLSRRTTVDEDELDYDQDLGLYTYEGRPFTGVATTRSRRGKLEDLVHYVRGDAHGVTVSWYPDGQIALYNEVANGVRHGLYMEWSEDGTVLAEDRYKNGRLVPVARKKPTRKK